MLTHVFAWFARQFTLLSVQINALGWQVYTAATAFVGIEVILGLLAFTAMLPSIPIVIALLALAGYLWQRLRRKPTESDNDNDNDTGTDE